MEEGSSKLIFLSFGSLFKHLHGIHVPAEDILLDMRTQACAVFLRSLYLVLPSKTEDKLGLTRFCCIILSSQLVQAPNIVSGFDR